MIVLAASIGNTKGEEKFEQVFDVDQAGLTLDNRTRIVHAISTPLIELPCLLHSGGMMAARMTTSGLRTVIRKVTVCLRL